MTASWLKQMGWKDVFVLAGSRKSNEKASPRRSILGSLRRRCRDRCPSKVLESDNVSMIDLSTQPALPARPYPRRLVCHPRPPRQGAAEDPAAQAFILTSEDGVLAGLAVAEAQRAHEVRRSTFSKAAMPPGPPPASRSPPTSKMADEPLDVWLKPYERPNDNEAAMNAYLSWEIDLLDRIKRDGTTHFLPSALLVRNAPR